MNAARTAAVDDDGGFSPSKISACAFPALRYFTLASPVPPVIGPETRLSGADPPIACSVTYLASAIQVPLHTRQELRVIARENVTVTVT